MTPHKAAFRRLGASHKTLIGISALVTSGVFPIACIAQATEINRGYLYPQFPTSADEIKIQFSHRACDTFSYYVGDSYRVNMTQNNITITFGRLNNGPGFNPCPPSPSEEVVIGRLPAGNYTITVIEPPATNEQTGRVSTQSAPMTVTDARANKAGTFVRSDYSGHWWDPNDSGWGLFVWQDARNPRDPIMAAWFTYGTDGKAIWYVFQPNWLTSTQTATTDLVQTQRAPGPSSPPPNPTTTTVVGSAQLSFEGFAIVNSATLTYKFGNGPTQFRSLRRFGF